MNTSDIPIDDLLKRLHLANARRIWRDLTARAEKEGWACRDFFAVLVAEEVAHRQQTRLARLTRRAHFPFLKTVDDFDFARRLRAHGGRTGRRFVNLRQAPVTVRLSA